MTSQLPCFGGNENRAAVTSLRSFLFRDDYSSKTVTSTRGLYLELQVLLCAKYLMFIFNNRHMMAQVF